MEVTPEGLGEFFERVTPLLDERQQRLVLGAMASMLGRGGKTAVSEAASVSRTTVIAGVREIEGGAGPSGRVRRPGAGRPRAIDKNPDLLLELDDLVSPDARGDPMSPLRWTLKSTRELADALRAKGFDIGVSLVGQPLHQMGYSLQGTAKQKEGAQHVDRDGQFRYINDQAVAHMADDQPVISVDAKKKELVGDYANRGKEWQPEEAPNESACTTSSTPRWARPSPTGCTTWPTMRAGCPSAMTPTPPRSR